MHIKYAKDGKTIVEEVPFTQPHPDGSGARDEKGRLYYGSIDDANSRAAAIAAAALSIAPGTEGAFTTTGKPMVETIEKLLGWNISRNERDLVWEQLKAKGPPPEAAAKPAKKS